MENGEYGKLVDFLDDKFGKIGQRFDNLEKRIVMTKIDLEGFGHSIGAGLKALDRKLDVVLEGQQEIVQILDRHIK